MIFIVFLFYYLDNVCIKKSKCSFSASQTKLQNSENTVDHKGKL